MPKQSKLSSFDTADLYVRVVPEDAASISASFEELDGLALRMRELGITDLPGRSRGAMVMEALDAYYAYCLGLVEKEG